MHKQYGDFSLGVIDCPEMALAASGKYHSGSFGLYDIPIWDEDSRLA